MAGGVPLAQTRVLDLSRVLPGPYCTRILADFGAEVLKIEQPDAGDWVRYAPPLSAQGGDSLLFQILNRGKKGVTLNLKSDEGRAILLQLAKKADVLVESFRPGVMERLGLGHETLAQLNPGLVYCSLTGYGPEGPYRERAGHDLNYIGLTGLLDLTGAPDGPPVVPGTQIADLAGALWAALGILLALLVREKTGKGQRVDASLLGGALACLPVALAQQWAGQPMARSASTLTGGFVCYHVYQTRDGAYMTVGALEPQFWADFCRAVACPHLLGQQFAPAIPGEPAYDELCALFRSRTRDEWMQVFEGADACCEPVYTLEEALTVAPVRALRMLTDAGLLPPLRLSTACEIGLDPAPALGQHTAELLAELGYDNAAVAELKRRGVV